MPSGSRFRAAWPSDRRLRSASGSQGSGVGQCGARPGSLTIGERRPQAHHRSFFKQVRVVTAVARATGIARSTITRGLAELRAEAEAAPDRVRRAGGGRKSLTATDATLLGDLQVLVEPVTRGDPMAPLLWTAKSLRKLATELQACGHRIGHNVVAKLLRELGYSLQANHKTL